MIPPQKLQNKDFRFVLIKPMSKIPYEVAWQQFNNYIFFHNKVKQSTNLGILCGKGGLIVLDIDDEKFVEEFDNKTNTFSVKTGSGKRHYYFICKEEFAKSYYVLKEGAGEVRVKNSQVVIPGSTNPNGKKYEVFKDIPIREITKDELLKITGELLLKDGEITDTTRSGQDWREVCQMIEAGYNFDDCDREMRLFDHSKWIEEGLSYQLGTYCNALQAIKNKEKQENI